MRSLPAILGWTACALLSTTSVWADDFRIENKVYSGKEKGPVSQSTTLFHAGYVYDYLSDPDRVAVFDGAHGRFILLDPKRELKTEIQTSDVLAFTETLQNVASKSSRAFMRFAADPQFETKFSDKGDLSMTSQYVTYQLVTTPAHSAEAAEQYRDFCDWYARLNAMSNVGSTPPFPRMVVNEELVERGLVPTEVQLNIPAQAALSGRAVSMRSEHHVYWRLLQRDFHRIAETGKQLATFKKVDFNEFQPTSVSAR